MFIENKVNLDDRLREIALEFCSEPEIRGRFLTEMKKFQHSLTRDLMEDFRLTLEAKRDEILNQFPIE